MPTSPPPSTLPSITIRPARSATRAHQLAPVLEGEKSWTFIPAPWREEARATAKMRGFAGAYGQLLLLPQGDRQWMIVGLGEPGALTPSLYQEMVATGFRMLLEAEAKEMDLLLSSALPWEGALLASKTAEAVMMASYAFTHYRSEAPSPARLDVRLVPEPPRGSGGLKEGIARAEAVYGGLRLARDLINHPAAVAHPGFVAAEALRVAKAAGASYKEIRGDDLKKAGFEAIHAVGRAAEHPPSLVALEYGKRSRKHPTLALVGKGVTFDSGGLDIKSTTGMALMKKDMGGAATVLGAFQAITALKLPLHLICVLGLAENAVDARAYRPGDILRTKHGPTVEVTNTDAEGRIVLADAMALAHQYKPQLMIDFATLTGACRVALGRDVMGLFSDHLPLREALMAAGVSSGDPLWPLPLWAPYERMLKSEVADMVNASSEGVAGAITAALFLKAFAGEVAWAHIDCYAWSEGISPLFPKGGSGAGVRLCVEFVERLLKDPLDASP